MTNDSDFNTSQSDHWLVRASTIRWLWIISIIVLILTVVAQLFLPVKGYFGFDSWIGFGALYGFLACLAMVLLAKALGYVLKRHENYYLDRRSDD